MYENFKNIPTRNQYNKVLTETIEYFKANRNGLLNELNVNILEQLNDIIEHLDNYESLGDTDNINQRYDLGAIAVNWLEDGSEAQQRLFDVFWGIIHYLDMPDC